VIIKLQKNIYLLGTFLGKVDVKNKFRRNIVYTKSRDFPCKLGANLFQNSSTWPGTTMSWVRLWSRRLWDHILNGEMQ
jgi:hypothetical protein